MSKPELYLGHWPQNVAKAAKYSVRRDQNEWKVSVIIQLEEGRKTLFAEDRHVELIEKVNFVKSSLGFTEGGTFYVNEFQHLIVPVLHDKSSVYYYAGKVSDNFCFLFDGKIYTSQPISSSGTKLNAGDDWFGPRPGIPYTLTGSATDIRYITNDFSRFNLNDSRSQIKMKVNLLDVCDNEYTARENIRMISQTKGSQGGRFYVNEHRAVFSPIRSRNEDGWKYVYCGEINMEGWFPEPSAYSHPLGN